MSEERDAFRVWLDRAGLTEEERAADADRVWVSPRRRFHGGWLLAAAASIALGVWWSRREPTPEREPEFASRLVVSVRGDEVRIQVGVRRKEDQ